MLLKKSLFINTILSCFFLTGGLAGVCHAAENHIPRDSIKNIKQQLKGKKTIQLFNGKNLKGWYSYLQYQGKNKDTGNVFMVKNHELHISGKEAGYIATNDTFKNFHLIAEFKWGNKKYPPRENDKRDNGILYFVSDTAADKVWPACIEYQVQEGDSGDFWLISGATIEVDGSRTQPGEYVRVIKKADAEKPHGEWNRLEIIVSNNKLTHIMNGIIVNEAFNPNMNTGRILVQSEYAETIYRKIELIKL